VGNLDGRGVDVIIIITTTTTIIIIIIIIEFPRRALLLVFLSFPWKEMSITIAVAPLDGLNKRQ
jgi:hypothetical protein